MRKRLSILLFLTSILAIGQVNSIEKPPKKTWKILIKNSNSKEDNYKLIGQTLIDNDFSIEKKDVEYFTLETTPRTTEDSKSSYYLKFIAKDNLIVLTGMAKSLITMRISGVNIESEYSKIRNIGMRGSIAKDEFNSMLNFAKLFLNCEFEFIVE